VVAGCINPRVDELYRDPIVIRGTRQFAEPRDNTIKRIDRA
jgi:hypothetical protein